jgi:hypothetical protein
LPEASASEEELFEFAFSKLMPGAEKVKKSRLRRATSNKVFIIYSFCRLERNCLSPL